MRELVKSIEAELRRYQVAGQGALDQLGDEDLHWRVADGENSVVVLVWHISGNLKSRFTDFMASDGEKPWRDRESEFVTRQVSREELLAKWNEGWEILSSTLSSLTDEQLLKTVTIRSQELTVHQALCQALAHISYHVGQIVAIARQRRGSEWRYLSIPPGESENYNRKMNRESGPAQE